MKALLIAAIAAVVLLGGSAAAYFGIVVPNQPENQFKQAIQNTIDGKNPAKSTKGKISFSGSGASGELGINMLYVDPASQAVLADLQYSMSGIKVPFEVRYVEGKTYIKAGDLSSLSSLLAGSNGLSAKQADALLGKISNQWVEVDRAALDEYGGEIADSTAQSTTCSAQELSTRSRAAINEWLALVSDDSSGAYVVTGSSNEEVDGVATTKIELDVDYAKVNELARQVEEQPAFKALEECLGESASSNDAEAAASGELTKFNVWIDGTKNFKRVEIGSKAAAEGTSGEFVMDFTFLNDAPTIEKPTDAKPLKQFVEDIQTSLSGGTSSTNPLNSLSL
jgi:hypothetical protein